MRGLIMLLAAQTELQLNYSAWLLMVSFLIMLAELSYRIQMQVFDAIRVWASHLFNVGTGFEDVLNASIYH